MKPKPKQSRGLVGGRNDMRDRGFTPHAEPRPLTRDQMLGDDALALDTRGRIVIDYDKLGARLVALGFVKQ